MKNGVGITAVLVTAAAGFAGPAATQQRQAAAPPTDEPMVVESLPEHFAHLYELQDEVQPSASQQVYDGTKNWEPGDTLKVCFFGGDAVVRTLIAEVAKAWSSHANLSFDFGPPGAFRNCMDRSAGFSQIRIGFSERGYWSLVGRDSDQKANQYQPSMNFDGFDQRYSQMSRAPSGQQFTVANVVQLAGAYHKGTIIHEFGHAIGLLHEFQNKHFRCNDEIRWEGPGNVFEYYAGPPNQWNPEKVLRNLAPLSVTDPNGISLGTDIKSVMMYSQPAAIFVNGTRSRCYTEPNNEISALDSQLVAKLYPRDRPAPSDTSFNVAASQPVPSAAPAATNAIREDRLERIYADLVSDVTTTRREARRQFALELQARGTPDLVKRLLAEAKDLPYRRQLGLMVALEQARLPFDFSPEDKAEVRTSLDALAAASRERSLSQTIENVRGRFL